ncbi:MAG: hypothetical protein AB7E61_04285 [Acholeplasmataceae bacterium]
MRTKDLKHLLKTESKQIVIPNVSSNIKDKLNSLVPNQQMIVDRPKRFNFKLAMSLSLTAVVILAFTFGFISINQSDPITDDSIVEAVVLSTMTSSTIAVESLNTIDEVQLLSNSNLSTDTTIETEVNHLTKYLGVIENVMNTSNNYSISKQRMHMFSKRYQVMYTSSNLEDEASTYQIEYEKTEKVGNIYYITGHVDKDAQVYQLEIQYNIETKSILTKTYQNETRYVEVLYEKDGTMFKYQVKNYSNDVLEEEVNIAFETTSSISLDFVNSAASGSYEFQIAIGMMNRKYLAINYNVDGHLGQMAIMVSQMDPSQYIVEITPQGGQSYTMTTIRGNWHN